MASLSPLMFSKLDWAPALRVLGDPRSQDWLSLHQWDHRLEIKNSVLSSALPGPKEPARDSCPLPHHRDCAFCRKARTSSASWRKDFLSPPPPP